MSVASFAKWFTAPIENVITPGADQAVTYANAESAFNVGLEIEGRVGLGALHPLAADLFLGGNGALIWSQVALPASGIQTSSSRPLEGQSPWIANAVAGWERGGASVSVLYNVFGPRIRDVGVLGVPDVYEQPLHQLDVVALAPLPWGLSLQARAQNLLDGESVLTQGGAVVERSRRGPSLSLALALRL